MNRREQRAELRAVARLLVEDLAGTADYLHFVIDTKRWRSLPDDATASVNAEAWDRHHLLIARELTDDDQWRTTRLCSTLASSAAKVTSQVSATGTDEAAPLCSFQLPARVLIRPSTS